ncbi:hypothetical protein ENUP19_0347G0005 [Entamoeba nuttalli]|uniref:Uncharacterized protein n=2 Tax=Entamoeba nuttalli TaxID=412467 RepID=K2H818_ENTNP|nr:hypothetical protein ENU1_159590 [Entamoeba nuttalli P19]EKE38634.1 hypothetical protein ENU1_159590 [Entamoeba nuttalli P19]|eukprot:XP_008859030.1 hypothetical protein ENU1_159590 [Entamoeba nuttalli P19]
MSLYKEIDNQVKMKNQKKQEFIQEIPSKRKFIFEMNDFNDEIESCPSIPSNIDFGFRPKFGKIHLVNGKIVEEFPQQEQSRKFSINSPKYSFDILSQENKFSNSLPPDFENDDQNDGPGTTVLIQPGDIDTTPVKSTDFPHISNDIIAKEKVTTINEQNYESISLQKQQNVVQNQTPNFKKIVNISSLERKQNSINLNQNIFEKTNVTTEIKLLSSPKLKDLSSISEDDLPIIEKKQFHFIMPQQHSPKTTALGFGYQSFEEN